MKKEKKYNLVYQTTNLVNGKIYIGVHRTDTLEDGYLGSGSIIQKAFKKYGIDNFKREILYNVENYELAFFIEELIVDKDFVAREDTYNIQTGGGGTWKEPELVKEKIKNTLIQYNKDNPKPRKSAYIKKGRYYWNKGKKNVYKSDALLKMSNAANKRKVKIICVTTGEIFESITLASRTYKISKSNLISHLKGKYKWCGKLADGTKLVWRYADV